MNDLGFAIIVIAVIAYYANTDGHFDKFIADENFKKVQELKELRKLDDEVIKDLQDRLKKAGLDNGIG